MYGIARAPLGETPTAAPLEKQLYELGSDDPCGELRKLNHTLLSTFLALLQTAQDTPSQCHVRVDEMRHLMLNMQHLINTFRPYQAREELISVAQAQVDAKRAVKEAEEKTNVSYMKRWTLQTDIENAQRKLVEQKRQDKINAVQNYIIEQMHSNGTNVKNASEVKIKRKFELGGQMNPEDARMNRELLKEIAKAKKEGVSQRLGSASLSQVI
jgi:hypothetical protein